MNSKKYNPVENDLPKVEEPIAAYGSVAIQNKGCIGSTSAGQIANSEPKQIEDRFNELKSEADTIYGVKKRMTVDEYFGKLRYMVNAFYDNVQN